MSEQARPQGSRHSGTAGRATRIALALALASAGMAHSAQVLTNGTFQTNTLGWSTTIVSGTPTFTWDATGAANGGSAKITSQTAKNGNFNGSYSQAAPTSILAGSTVLLSFSYKKNWVTQAPAAGFQNVAVVIQRPDATTSTVWSNATITQMASFTDVAPFDVSATFTQDGTYTIQLQSSGRTGNATGSYVEAWFDEVVLDVSAPGATTTLGNGIAGTTGDVCPGASGSKLDGFSFVNSAGTNPVTALTVTTTGQAAIASMEIRDEAGGTQYFGTVTNPGSNTWSFSGGTSIPVTTSAADFRVVVTYRDQATAPPGLTSTTAYVSAFTTANSKTGTDSADTTLTLDNASPAAPTGATCTPAGASQIDLTWTNPGSDFVGALVVRGPAGGAAPSFVPSEGVTYTTGAQGSDTIVAVGAVAAASDTGLSSGTTYAYRIYAYDTCRNYSTALATSCTTPAAPGTTTQPPTATVNSCTQITVSAPFSGDSDADGSVQVEYNTTNSWPGTTACAAVTGPSPRTCAVSTLSNATSYYFRVTFSDPTDGVTGPNPQVIGPYATYDCRVAPAAPTAAATACEQVTVSAPFSGDQDADSSTTFARGTSAGGPFTNVSGCVGLTGASPRSCVDSTATAGTYYYQVTFTDSPEGVVGTNPQVTASVVTSPCTAAGTTAGTVSALVSGCRQVTVSAPFTGDGDGDGSVAVEYNTTNTWPGTAACTVVGASPRTCIVTNLSPSTAYYVRTSYADPDGVTGTSPQVLGPLTTSTCSGNGAPPMLLFLSPSRNAVVGGAETFKVQVHAPNGITAGNLLYSVNGGATTAMNAGNLNANYTCGTSCAVYQFPVVTTSLTNGPNYATVRATDGAGIVAQQSQPFVVNNASGAAAGAGTLLRRTSGSQLCIDCHALSTHSSQATSFKYGNWAMECSSCHTPHATTNIYLIRPSIVTPNSGSKPVSFRNTTGVAANSFGTPQASGNGVNVCEVCHTKTKHADATPRARNSSPTDWTKHYSGDCRACHKHEAGFVGGGESGGNDDCIGCHKFGMALSETDRSTTYHHVMEAGNVLTGGLSTYPTSSTPTVSTATVDKTCLQCHADHNIFNPATNTSNSLGRGANLRSRIANGPPTGSPPSPSAPGDAAPGYYTNADANTGYAAGGICLSCHTNDQTKNVTDQKTYTGDPGQTVAVVSGPAAFGSSSHAYAVGGQVTSGSSAYTVPCSKCHSGGTTQYQNGTYKFQLHASANRRLLNPLGISSPGDPLGESFCFRCHSRSTDTTPGGGPAKGTANRDYYDQVAMSSQSEAIFAQFSNAGSYPWDHPVQGTGSSHDPLEGTAANDGTLSGTSRHVQCEDCHNPHAAGPIASGALAGSLTGYTTAADPNPDTLTDSTKAWTTNAYKGFTVKITSGSQAGKYSTIYANTATALSVNFGTAPAAGDKYVVVNWGVTSTNAAMTGNRVSPAMAETWGLNPTWVAQPSPPNWNDSAGTATAAEITGQYNAITTWNRTNAATVQGQICIKCHSAYAYGASPPNTPSGRGNSTATTWVNTAGAATAQSDIADQFNPNNLAHHAVFARGKNQPLVSSDATTSTYNPGWPKYTTGTLTATNGSTAVTLAGGTWPVTILPGWFLYIGNTAPAQATAGWYEIASVGSTTTLTLDRNYTGATGSGKAFMLTAGLGNNFVPPWGPWSTLSCSDCHTSSVASDPFGPHGSAVKWLLRGGEAQNFLFYNGTTVATVTTTPDSYNMCLNCHRRDVYGDYTYSSPTSAGYARQSHPIDAGKNHSLEYRTNWGIPCMNCHGGARIGQIHGSNLGRGFNGAGGSYSGRRLLAGSSWYAVTRSSTTTAGACWTKGATDAVDNCGHTHGGIDFLSGTNGMANYNYETATP